MRNFCANSSCRTWATAILSIRRKLSFFFKFCLSCLGNNWLHLEWLVKIEQLNAPVYHVPETVKLPDFTPLKLWSTDSPHINSWLWSEIGNHAVRVYRTNISGVDELQHSLSHAGAQLLTVVQDFSSTATYWPVLQDFSSTATYWPVLQDFLSTATYWPVVQDFSSTATYWPVV